MLTALQCQTIAYMRDGAIVCPRCADAPSLNSGDLKPVIRYEAEEYAGADGLYCDRCTREIVEPTSRDVTVTLSLTVAPGTSAETITAELDSWLDSVSWVARHDVEVSNDE